MTPRTDPARLIGELLLPGDADYDEARSVWNEMVYRRPKLIARCASVADHRSRSAGVVRSAIAVNTDWRRGRW